MSAGGGAVELALNHSTKVWTWTVAYQGLSGGVITLQDIDAVADRYEMRKLVAPVITQIKAALDCWPRFAKRAGVQAQAMFAKDLTQSDPITLERWQGRSADKHIKEWFGRVS